MAQYIYIHTNKFSRWFLLRYLKKKGYTFRNNMTQEYILFILMVDMLFVCVKK